MGQVCTNPLEYLIDEYGEDVGKFIVAEKSKRYFEQKYPQVKKELGVETNNFQNEVLKKVDTESEKCLTNITTNIEQLKSAHKDEVEMFEKTSDKKVDDFVGIGSLKGQFDKLKAESKTKLDGLQKNILSEADVLADKQKGLIEAQKPSIPTYDRLPQCLKDKVWEDGQKKFGPMINEEQAKTEAFLKKSMNFEEMKKKFAGNLPTDDVGKISSSVEEKLNQVKKAVDMSSGIGSIGDKVKGFLS